MDARSVLAMCFFCSFILFCVLSLLLDFFVCVCVSTSLVCFGFSISSLARVHLCFALSLSLLPCTCSLTHSFIYWPLLLQVVAGLALLLSVPSCSNRSIRVNDSAGSLLLLHLDAHTQHAFKHVYIFINALTTCNMHFFPSLVFCHHHHQRVCLLRSQSHWLAPAPTA